MMTYCRALLLLVLTCQTVFALEKPQLVSVNQTTKPIVVTRTSPDFQLRLPANPTTGFDWYMKSYNHRLIRVVRNHYEAPTSTLLGAGGVSVWTFRVVPEAFKVPHMTEVVLVYMRQFDSNSVEEKKFTIVTNPSHSVGHNHLHHFIGG